MESQFAGARDWGLLMTFSGLGAVAAGAFVARVKPRRPLRVAYAFGFAMPIQLVALGFVAPLPLLVVGAGLVFFEVIVMNVYWATMEQQHVPRHLISRVDAFSWLISLLVMPLGLATVGRIADTVGVRLTLLCAACLAAVSLGAALMVRDLRDLERLDALVDDVTESTPAG
jgi:hypothetical protein